MVQPYNPTPSLRSSVDDLDEVLDIVDQISTGALDPDAERARLFQQISNQLEDMAYLPAQLNEQRNAIRNAINGLRAVPIREQEALLTRLNDIQLLALRLLSEVQTLYRTSEATNRELRVQFQEAQTRLEGIVQLLQSVSSSRRSGGIKAQFTAARF